MCRICSRISGSVYIHIHLAMGHSNEDRVLQLEQENEKLRGELERLRLSQRSAVTVPAVVADSKARGPPTSSSSASWDGAAHSLTKHQVERYSRQVLLGSFGPHGEVGGLGWHRDFASLPACLSVCLRVAAAHTPCPASVVVLLRVVPVA